MFGLFIQQLTNPVLYMKWLVAIVKWLIAKWLVLSKIEKSLFGLKFPSEILKFPSNFRHASILSILDVVQISDQVTTWQPAICRFHNQRFDLEGNSLFKAILQQAILQQATLQQAILQQAISQQAGEPFYVQQGILQQASSQQAISQQAILQQAILQQPILQQAISQQAILQQAILQQAISQHAILQQAISLQQAILQQARPFYNLLNGLLTTSHFDEPIQN